MWGPSLTGRCASWNTTIGEYNLSEGLRAVCHGSAFLPAFVLDGCFATLDEVGFEFVRKCLEAIEARGMKEQGLYRNCGVTSKVQKLMQIGLDKRRSLSEKLNFSDDVEWETKTVSSAVKTYLRYRVSRVS
ncbi:hypothetical protein AB6A40_008197 [Gnathostoma spinigerum]|uniref:Rho-GAP domain-containing protein n=1 Tax=Gnathostoma spinigerum TaxID=75299 RepID=A0ABD6ENE4_9BILA